MALYFKASSEIELLDEYFGKKGRFVKTFAINDKRNKNGWRATWEGIKKNIHTFLDDGGRPGIEYVACDGTVCDLDHTDGTTKEISIDVQEDFRVTTLIDFTLNEDTHTAYFIHEVLSDETWEKLEKQLLKFVSPSLWPKEGGFDIIGTMPNGLPKLDVWEWDGLHTAFVNNPAFGDEARVTAMCEGENCHMKLLSAKQLKAETDDGLGPLRQIPILIKHKGKLRFVSVDKEIADRLNANHEKDIAINEETLLQIISEHEKTHSKNTSFSACQCSGNQMDDTKQKELEATIKANEDKIKELESALKSNEDEKKTLESKLSAMEDEESDKIKSAKKAQEESEEEAKTAKKAAEDSEKENTELKAKIAEPLIASIINPLKERLDANTVEKIETSLKAKTIPELEEQILMSNLSASESIPGKHFEFSDGTTQGSALSAKSLEETMGEVEAKA